MGKGLFVPVLLICFLSKVRSQDTLPIKQLLGEWKVCRSDWMDSVDRICWVTNRFLPGGIYEQPNVSYKACLNCPTETITISGQWYVMGNELCIETPYVLGTWTRRVVDLKFTDCDNFSGLEYWPSEPDFPEWCTTCQRPRTHFTRKPLQ